MREPGGTERWACAGPRCRPTTVEFQWLGVVQASLAPSAASRVARKKQQTLRPAVGVFILSPIPLITHQPPPRWFSLFLCPPPAAPAPPVPPPPRPCLALLQSDALYGVLITTAAAVQPSATAAAPQAPVCRPQTRVQAQPRLEAQTSVEALGFRPEPGFMPQGLGRRVQALSTPTRVFLTPNFFGIWLQKKNPCSHQQCDKNYLRPHETSKSPTHKQCNTHAKAVGGDITA